MEAKSESKELNREIQKPQYKSCFPTYACGCGCFNQPKEKEDCYFYHGEYHMGGTIPTCNYYEKLGYCPCEGCNKYVPRKEVSRRVFQAVKDYVDKREIKIIKFLIRERRIDFMTLLELQKVLGDRIAIHSDLAMDSEEREKENETSDIIARLAKQMINNADVVLRTDKLISEGKLNGENTISKIVGSDKNA